MTLQILQLEENKFVISKKLTLWDKLWVDHLYLDKTDDYFWKYNICFYCYFNSIESAEKRLDEYIKMKNNTNKVIKELKL